MNKIVQDMFSSLIRSPLTNLKKCRFVARKSDAVQYRITEQEQSGSLGSKPMRLKYIGGEVNFESVK